MKYLFLLLYILPLIATAQTPVQNELNTDFSKKKLESQAVNLKTTPGVKMDVLLGADGSSFFLTLLGSGAGTGTIDANDETVFTLENDSTITIKSAATQGFESKDFVNTYKHDYIISQEALETLSRYPVRRIRKYSLKTFNEIALEEKNAASLKKLSAGFLQELEKSHLLKAKNALAAPAFPGGKDVFLTFLNRNLKVQENPMTPEKKEGLVQFQVGADGSINDIQVKQSAGALFDNELLRILKRMPKWKPAVENGKQVDAVVTQPVTFYSQNSVMKVQF